MAGECGHMTIEPENKINPIRTTTLESIRLSKTLIRHARFGALAFIDPQTGGPGVSRVAVAPDITGMPVVLISHLSAHTKALLKNPDCSILLGEPGKGDPLAHPRISLSCRAEFLDRETPENQSLAARYLRRNPKAALYASFADFTYVRLNPLFANLNGGFGQAYRLANLELLSPAFAGQNMLIDETEILDRLNTNLASVLADFCHTEPTQKAFKKIIAISVDSEGIDVAAGSELHRIWLPEPSTTKDKLFNLLLKQHINLRKQ